MTEPVFCLIGQAWMYDPPLRRLLAALSAEGGEVRFVGGCVRDAVLGRSLQDIDLATPSLPQHVIERLRVAGIRSIPTGIDHGTVTAIVDGHRFEITTLRADIETFGRHARVAFGEDWIEDARRRDFTINAVSADPDGRVYDPFGGLEDALAGKVRFVGTPLCRIEEDVLRVFRFFRFHAYYGHGAPDAEAVAACRRSSALLSKLSAERVRDELIKILAAPDPAPILRVMQECDVLAVWTPELIHLEALRRLVAIADPMAADPLLRLAVCLDITPAQAEALSDRLRFARSWSNRLSALSAHCLQASVDERALRRSFYRHGKDMTRQMILLAQARAELESERQELAHWFALSRTWPEIIFPLRGQDVIDHGGPSGKEIGAILRQIEAWWEEEDYRPNRQACLDRLIRLIRTRRPEHQDP